MKNPTLVTIALASICCATTASNAAEHQWEVDFGTAIDERHYINRPDLDYSISGTYYFSPIDSSTKYPIEEIAFAERIGEANFSFQTTESVFKRTFSDFSYTSTSDTETFGVGGIFRSGNSPHAFALEYNHTSSEGYFGTAPDPSGQNYQSTGNDDVFLIGYDYYISELMTIGAFAKISDKSTNINRNDSVTPIDSKTETLGLKLEKLWNLKLDNWVRMDLGLVYNYFETEGSGSRFTYNDFSAIAGGTYYFNKKTSIGAGLSYNFDSEDLTYQANFTRHVSDKIKLGLNLDYNKLTKTLRTEGRIGFKF